MRYSCPCSVLQTAPFSPLMLQPAHVGHLALLRSLIREGAAEGGYELWLAGLEFGKRGGGHGRALLASLMSTPPGQKTYVVRVQRTSRYVQTVTHLLDTLGFDSVGETTRLRWFVRRDAPVA